MTTRKSYIQSELVGDEDPDVIDMEILKCCLQERIYEILTSSDGEWFLRACEGIRFDRVVINKEMV